MTKLTKLLILFIMLSTGVISCTVNSLVTDKDIINQQYNDFIKENGLPSREEMLLSGEVEVADLVEPVKTDAKQSATTKTRNRHASDKNPIYKLPDVQKNTSPIGEVDSFRRHVNLGNAYRKEGKDERAVLEYEKVLALKPEHSIAKKSLSELYYSLGSTRLDDKEYVSAIDAFNKVLEINPAFPQIRDALERAHYDLGVHYAINGEPNKAIQEFNKNMGSGSGHAVLDKNNRITIGTGKDGNGVSGKIVHRGGTNFVESVSASSNNNIRKKRTVLPSRTNNEVVAIRANTPVRKLYNRGVVNEMGLADSVNTGKSGKSQVKGQPSFTVRQGSNKNKLISSDKMPPSVGQLQMVGGAKPGNVQIIDPQERWSNQKKRMVQTALPAVASQEEKPLNKVGLAHFDLGVAFVDSGMVDDAIRELQSAVGINPNHLESHVSLGAAYRLNGMTNKALSEFKKAADINPGEAVANIACNSLSVAETSPKGEMDIVNGHVKLGNEYRKEGKGKRAVLEYEKVLALKPEHSIAKKSLSELYYRLGSTSLRNREYTSAINSFNRVLEINPGFPRIRDSLEKAHYDFGVHFAKNGELNKAIVEFNKTMKVGSSYAMLDKKQQAVLGTGKDEKIVSGKVVRRGGNNHVESASVSSNNNIRKKRTVLPSRTNNEVVAIRANTPVRKSYNRGVVNEMGLAVSVNTGKSGKSQVKGQPSFAVRQGSNKNKLISSDKMPPSVGQLQMVGGAKPGNVQIIDPQERWSNQKKRMVQSALPAVASQEEKPLNKVGLAHFDLGVAFVDSGMVDDAIRELQSAVEINPNHLESHVSLGAAYRLNGMTNKALSEFKKAADINPGEAAANIACNSLSVAETSPKGEMDIVNGHVKLGNEYRKEGKGKRAVLEYEKVLALKPEHSIAKKSLSELYYRLGSTSLRNREYTSAINSFNRVLEINPGFPRIRDSLEKAHYDFGVHFAKNGELNKAIVEFNKTMKVGSSYAMLDKKQQAVLGTGKDEKVVSGKVVRRGGNNHVESASVSSNNNIRKKRTVLPSRTNNEVVAIRANTPVRKSYNRGIVNEMGLAGKGSAKEVRNTIRKSVQSRKISSNTWQSQGANSLKREKTLLKSGSFKDGRNEKQVHRSIANKQTAAKQRTGERRLSNQSHMDTDTRVSSYGEKAVDKNKTRPDYQVYSYKIITNNNKSKIGVNEAIKKYEDATIKSPYDNNAFNNLANAYYNKAMCVDEAIARKEGASEGNQNFSVKRYYLDGDTDSEKISHARSFGQTKHSGKYYNNFGYKLGNVYAQVSPEDIIKYKNALRDNPKSSDALYGLAFSFSVKGSATGVALKSENNHKEMSFGY